MASSGTKVSERAARLGTREALRKRFLEDTLRHGLIPLQEAMVYRSTPRMPAPPLPALLSPGPANAQLRIKLWLWLLLLANGRSSDGGNPRIDQADLSPRPLMERLAIEPGTDDARRIDRAVRRLVDAGHLRPAGSRGELFDVTREDFVSGRGNAQPGRSDLYDRRWAERIATRPATFTMPLTLWWNGWLAALDHRALCALFALRHLCAETGTWYRIPRVLRDRYTLTPPVWTAGVRELYVHGLIDVVDIGPTNPDSGIPQRWIRPAWDRLSGDARRVAAREPFRAHPAAGAAPPRKFARFSDIVDAVGADVPIEHSPLAIGRPVRDLEQLYDEHQALKRHLAKADDDVVRAEMERLVAALDPHLPKTVDELTPYVHYRVERTEARKRVAALIEIFAKEGLAKRHTISRGAVLIDSYTRA